MNGDGKMAEIEQEVFLIPTEHKSGSIVYAPLKGVCFWLCEKYAKQFAQILEKKENVNSICDSAELYQRILLMDNIPSKVPRTRSFCIDNHVVFILSQHCNFKCSYCYAREAHSNDTINWDIIKKALDVVLKSKQHEIKITFIGGGEPLITFDLIMQTVNYAERKAHALNKHIHFALTTNGSLISPECAHWLKEHNFTVSVSFEILPEIQNKQRPMKNNSPSYDVVHEGIAHLIREGIPIRFRSTITEENVSRMKQMVQLAVVQYPNVKQLHFEPVSDSAADLAHYYDSYSSNFFEARKVAIQSGVSLTNSILSSIHYTRDVFCSGEYCVVPSGEIVSCHRASAPTDSLYNYFYVCSLNDDIMGKSLCSGQIRTKLLPACLTCFARWNCAGACSYNRQIYSEQQMQLLCGFTRSIIKKYLEEILSL